MNNKLSASNLTENIKIYLESLRKTPNSNFYMPLKNGVTNYGKELKLGFSTYALKLNFILNEWDNLSGLKKNSWINDINAFQTTKNHLPKNSFIDEALYNLYINPPLKKEIKNRTKQVLTITKIRKYESQLDELNKAIRADSKQAIATLFQVGNKNHLLYEEFPKNKSEIYDFINNLNWYRPWNAGAQFASICVFSKTQSEEKHYQKQKIFLFNEISKFASKETGSYHLNNVRSNSEIINGAMKVLTGLDWLDESIHYPEKLIDFSLNNLTEFDGCHIVDLIYVLYKCSSETSYKKKEVLSFLNKLKQNIFNHYYPDEGGFSYYSETSQKYYYGGEISKGKKCADLHGTLLFCWGLSMIDKLNEKNEFGWKVIKP